MTNALKMSLVSPDPNAERAALLRQLFPDAVTEGKIDFERLRQALGESVATDRERYELSWAGKSEARRILQSPSMGTLAPDRAASVNFDTTENMIIEGDNLEVLKLLQKDYTGRVKMIYIDPPYNTGNEFIYPDNFREGLQDYLRYSGQVKDEKMQSTDTERSGQIHSKWLSMMYPRLFLAKNLMCSDGVVFVSIDDNEIHNLRLLMNEIFGEESFVATFMWKKKSTTTNVEAASVSSLTEYILAYGKNSSFVNRRVVEKESRSYPNTDKEGNYRTIVIEKKNAGSYERKTMQFDILGQKPRTGKRWQIGEDTARALEEKHRFLIDNGIVKLKIYDYEDKDTYSANPNLLFDHGSTDSAAKEVNDVLFQTAELFENPKPKELLKQLIRYAESGNKTDLIIDFFAGSGTLGQAVCEVNSEDGSSHKYILVQLPELTDKDTPAFRAGYKNIAQITRERMRKYFS